METKSITVSKNVKAKNSFISVLKVFNIAVAVLVFSVFASQYVEAQIPCEPEAKTFYYTYPTINYSPDLQSDMPYDIMVGYIIADSILRNINNVDNIYSLIGNLENNDTLNYAIKYMYRLKDYDPIRYFRFVYTSFHDRPSGGKLSSELFNRALSFQTEYSERSLLLKSDYILHIKIGQTILIDNIGGAFCKDATVSFATVLDTIKGQVLPNSNSALAANNTANHNTTNSIPNSQHNIIFEYCNQWTMNEVEHNDFVIIDNEDPGMYDANGEPWAKPNGEYIIFLDIRFVCNDGINGYYSLTPITTSSGGMYPIINGQVLDRKNEFGLGTEVPIDEFKQRLQEKIDFIKNYGE